MPTTILIVTHNSQGHIRRCLERAANSGARRILVIDNDSTDLTLDEVRRSRLKVDVVANRTNRGFAGAVNQGFQECVTPLVLLLNPDAEWRGGLAELERRALAHGMSCGQLTDDDGQPQSGFSVRRFPTAAALMLESLGINRLWPSNAVNRGYRGLDLDLSIAQFVEQPAGAMLMIRRDVWESLDGFDEQFHPVWFEDVDFCKRAIAAGHRIAYTPAASAVHAGGHSVNRMPDSARLRAWYGSLLRYAAKHFSGPVFRLICASVAVGCGLRLTAAVVGGLVGLGAPGSRQELAKVLGLAGRSLVSGQVEFPVPPREVSEGQTRRAAALVR